jgi:hypothetical protein
MKRRGATARMWILPAGRQSIIAAADLLVYLE